MADTEAEVIELELNAQGAELVLEELAESFGSLRSLVEDIGREMAKVFAPLQRSLQKVERSVDGMTDALTDAGTALQELLTELDASQMLDTIGTVVDSVALMTDWVVGFEKIKPIFKTIGSMLLKVSSGITGVFGDFILNVGDLTAKLSGIITGVFGKMAIWLKSAGTAIAAVGGKIGTALIGAAKGIGAAFASIGTWITGTLVPAITGAFGAIGSAVGAAAAALGISAAALVAIIVAVVAAITAAVIAIVKNWDTISLAFTTFFTETLPQLWAQFTQWVSGIAATVTEGASAIITQIVAIFTPIAQWFGALFGSIRQTVSDVFYNIGVIVAGCWEILQAVWGVVAQWFRSNVTEPVGQFFSGLWESVSTWAFGAWEKIKDVFATVGQWFSEYVIQPVANFFASLWEKVKTAAAQAWDGIKSVFSNVAGFFGDVFSDAWAKVVAVFSIAGDIFVNIRDGILTAFKKIVNGIISGINSVVRIPFNGINSALSKLRGTSILGISPFSGLGYISVPQIPYLAQGAVLPANKPFLAVVGDQRHGTNVEAPLATIQQAVGLVLEDQISAMMAGFQALLEEQRATRMAVESIRVGDDTIAAAVDRHQVRMAMMRGY